MVYAGTLDCYGKSGEILQECLSVQVSATQVFRLTDLYGEELGKQHDFTRRSQSRLKSGKMLCVEADASMLLTREHGWKDVKVGPGV